MAPRCQKPPPRTPQEPHKVDTKYIPNGMILHRKRVFPCIKWGEDQPPFMRWNFDCLLNNTNMFRVKNGWDIGWRDASFPLGGRCVRTKKVCFASRNPMRDLFAGEPLAPITSPQLYAATRQPGRVGSSPYPEPLVPTTPEAAPGGDACCSGRWIGRSPRIARPPP